MRQNHLQMSWRPILWAFALAVPVYSIVVLTVAWLLFS